MAQTPVATKVNRASFSILSKEDIKQISVKKITEPKSFGKAGAIDPDGLYSLALGPVKRAEICTTCGLPDTLCPGHYGHIELSVPVYHPMLVQTMYQIISKCCLECFHFRLSSSAMALFLRQLEALNNGFDHLIEEFDDIAKDLCRDDKSGSDEYTTIRLAQRLAARIKEEKEKTPEFDCKKRPQQRSIVESLTKLFRNFINGHLIKPQKVCPNCGEKKTTMYLHQQSVLVVGTNSSKPLDEDLADMDKSSGKKKGGSSKRKKRRTKSVDESTKSKDLQYLRTDEKKFLTPIGAQHIFRQLWKNEKATLMSMFHFLNVQTKPTNEAENIIKRDGDEQEEEEDDDDDDKDPKELVKREKKFQPIDLFFVDTILVPPGKFRPPMVQRGYTFEGPRTASLANVMKQSTIVQDCIDQIINNPDEVEAEKLQPKLQAYWKDLQVAVNCLFDNEMDKYGKNKHPGLKQLIDKKEGLFRKNMMGKRVNFAARSVISPDPNISVDQIGVPLVFAKRLTYPEPVTPFNLEQLKQAVLNGPDKYPGAVSVLYDDGTCISLTKETVRQNVAARLSYNPRYVRSSKNKPDTSMATIINRHLLDGDVLLFNRQPTLHKPSIMAFRARVLPNEKGFRLHYANCKSFNADFDGDEMNAHFPQSELARSEAYNLASVNFQYLVPKDGSPLGGLIQDHVVAPCIMTRRDQFFNQEHYNQLIFCALQFLGKQLKLEPPTIIKPTRLWTGKQVITTIIKNCIPTGKPYPTLDIKSKISPKILNISAKYEKLSDCHVHIRQGELVVGFMDKSNVGATQYGLIHTCYELYGGETSSNLMSAFARLSTWYLQLYEGFTLGIADILVEDDANEDRQKAIQRSLTVGPESAKEAVGLTGSTYIGEDELEDKLREVHSDRDPLGMKKLDASMKKRTDNIASEISGRCLPGGLIRKFPDNNLQLMIQSGAKGGTVNALQISCLLGQIELEGRRVPLSMSGRSLPSYKPYDVSPQAGGFVSGRFLTGIQPQEFFFHCMAGREGLIDTAVKTSRSGYLQRCLIKHLEGLTVHYDQTVRDSCGSVIQFLYGEDGLDICRSQMLKSKAFPLLIENVKIIGPTEDETSRLNKLKESYEDEVIARTDDIQQWLEKNGDNRIKKVRGSGFLDFLASKLNEVKESMNQSSVSKEDVEDVRQQVTEVEEGEEERKPDCDTSAEGDESACRNESKSSRGSFGDGSPEAKNKSSGSCGSSGRIGSHHHDEVFMAWYALSFKEKRKWNRFWEPCPDPLIAIMNPGSHFGVVPEKLDDIIDEFVRLNPRLVVDSAKLLGQMQEQAYIDCETNPELSRSILAHWTGKNDSNLSGSCNKSAALASLQPKLTKHEFYELCYNLYMKMLAQPGEAVGLLAAQSIGEPSTQMTLNTFHFAGRGEMNVTLGIPRLREILMTASAKIGTPSMDLPLLPVMYDEIGNELDAAACEQQAKRVKLALNAVRLSDVLEYVEIKEQVVDEAVFDKGESISGVGRNSAKKRSRGSKSAAKGASTSVLKGGQQRSVRYDLEFAILPSKYYKHEFKTSTSKVLRFIEEVFVFQLIDSMLKRQKRLSLGEEMFDVSTRRKVGTKSTTASGAVAEGGSGDVEEQELDDYNAKESAKERSSAKEEGDGAGSSSDDDDDDGDGDNTTQRMRSRRNADLDYEEPEEDDLEVGELEARAKRDEEESPDNNEVDEDDVDDDDEDGGNGGRTGKLSAKTTSSANDNNKDVVAAAAAIEDEELKPAGETLELASFDDDDDDGTGTRSGFVTPINNGSDVDEPPASKKKRLVGAKSSSKTKTKTSSRRKVTEIEELERINAVKCIPYVVGYEFDTKRERWCKVSVCMNMSTTRLDMGALVSTEARRTFVHRVGDIQRALLVKDVNAKQRLKNNSNRYPQVTVPKCDLMIKTEGVSLLSLVKFNHILDLNAIYSNDIHAIARTYGIEAAVQAIRREMANVFAVYGIEVDPRHLSLIADYMTYNGSIRGMNRMSMEASASPFQQMSFESTLRYLKSAAILGLYDDIKSPSASLVFGQPTRGGTGLFQMLVSD